MAEAGHNTRSRKNPHPSTLHAFLLEGWRILDAEKTPEIWQAPVPPPPGATPREAERIERLNRILLIPFTETLRSDLEARARECGVMPENPATELLVEAWLTIERRSLQEDARFRPRKPFRWDPSSVIVHCVAEMLRLSQHWRSEVSLREAVSERLSRGLPPARSKEGLTVWHVRNALWRYNKDRARFVGSIRRVFDHSEFSKLDVGELLALFDTKVMALLLIEAKARSHPEFKHFRGRELAARIDHAKGFAACFDRAMSSLAANS